MKKIIGFYRKCDLMTMSGTFMAVIGMIMLKDSHFAFAILCLIAAGLCDAFDGHLARSKKYSKIQKTYGVQLDSLSDVICFGVLPALIAITTSSNIIVYIIGAFYVLCGVIRLAYFNTLNIESLYEKNTFIGVPITTVSIVLPLVFVITKVVNGSLINVTIPITLLLLGASYIIGIKYPKIDVASIIKKAFNVYVVDLLILPFLLVFCSDLVFKLNYYGIINALKYSFITMIHHIMPTIVVALIVLLIYLIFVCITKKTKVSKIIIISLIFALVLINDIKFNIMNKPIEFSDINYLNPDNLKMVGNSTSSVGPWIFTSIFKTLLMAAICFFTSIRNVKLDKFDIKRRIVVLVVSLLVLIGGISGLLKNETMTINTIYRTKREDITAYFLTADLYKDTGFWQGFLLNTVSKSQVEPDGYNRIYVDKLLAKYDDVKNTSWGKANVVFILSESFSDLDNIETVTFDKDLMPNIHSYEKDKGKMVFDLIVPTFGGASVNAEFEILTGASLVFYPADYIPYTQYYNNVSGKYAPNLIKEFNNNGYETMYLTSWGKESYKSEYVYKLLGTDTRIYEDSIMKGKKKGYYYSDESLMDAIYEQLKTTSKDNYKFIMAATAQNHYPYDGKYAKYDVKIKKSSLDRNQNTIVLDYAQGIYDADKELNRLYNMIQELDTPTIIVFYGDHLPYTKDANGNDPYAGDNYFSTQSELLNYIRKYTTKAVILANFELETEDIEVMNASYLGAYVISHMDLDVSNYYKFISDLSTKIPAFNRKSFKKDGELYTFEELEEETKLLKDYELVQYRELYDY